MMYSEAIVGWSICITFWGLFIPYMVKEFKKGL